jgi:hypothetical protein
MKKSLLIIAAMFLVQMANSQSYPFHPTSNHGHHDNHQPSYHNSNNTYTQNHCHTSNVVACCSPNYGNSHGNGNNHEVHFMTNNELNSIVNAIRNESFSSNKLAIARQAVMFQNVKAHQVVEIGNLFSFESDRLEFAKMAYNNTIDKQNYYLVNSIFHFSSSKRELNEFKQR